MKLKDITKDELETMPFDDIAYIILKEKGKKMKTNDIFKIICDKLGYSENAFVEQIGDFFTLLATEKRFIQLPKGFWDLKENNKAEIIVSDDDDIEDEIILDEEANSKEEEEVDFYDEVKDADDDESDDDLKDLVVIDDNFEDESDM